MDTGRQAFLYIGLHPATGSLCVDKDSLSASQNLFAAWQLVCEEAHTLRATRHMGELVVGNKKQNLYTAGIEGQERTKEQLVLISD